jgi:hypothetical protein
MSKSDAVATRYLLRFALASISIAALVISLTWAVDPLSTLHPYGGGKLCGIGIKSSVGREHKLVAAVSRQPREVIVGSSRVVVGFTRRDTERLFTRPAFNLGFHNASVKDTDLIIRETLQRVPLKRVWLALEFGNFTNRVEDRPPRTPSRLPMPFFAWHEGLFSPAATRMAMTSVFRREPCRHPPVDSYGFLTAHSREWRERAGFREIQQLATTWGLASQEAEDSYAARLRQLEDLLRGLRFRDVKVVLFLSPMSNSYRQKVEEAGLTELYDRWRADVRSVAQKEGAALVEADTDSFLDEVGVDCPPGSTRDECLFYDTIHFRPPVGAAILAAGAHDSTGRT